MFGAPYSGILTLLFLAVVLVLTAFDYPVGTWTVASLVVIIPALIIGWFAARRRVLAIAYQREGYTGEFPVVANIPIDGE